MFKIFAALSLVLVLVLAAQHSFAKGEAQKARFEPWISHIENTMTSNSKTEMVAGALLEGENRIATFNLQALGKLYSVQDSDFASEIRASFKSLEDGIGAYDMWKKIADKSGKAKDQERADKAKKDFAKMLEKDHWVSGGKKDRLKSIRAFLDGQKWHSYEDDKNMILAQLAEQVESIAATEYDLTRLEKDDGDGNGLHELRREIRWLMIESRVLNGMLQFRKNSQDCSVADYEGLYKTSLAQSKYSTLPGSSLESDPCYIQQCLFLGLSGAVNILGEIKDAAEQDQEARETDTVPKELQLQAETLYKELKNTEIFSKMGQNLRQCMK